MKTRLKIRTKEKTVPQEAVTLLWVRKGSAQKRWPEASPSNECQAVKGRATTSTKLEGNDMTNSPSAPENP